MKLGLGAVQFGTVYGATNKRGQVPWSEVVGILRAAADAGVTVIDTAAAYGDSESVLGSVLWDGHPFRIVTKVALPGDDTGTDSSPGVRLADAVRASIRRLQQPSIYGLLFHTVEDLAGPEARSLVNAALDLKAQGVVERVGVSVYSSNQIDLALSAFIPDIVQAPLSVLDQRLLASGQLGRLKSLGVEFHARSVFLQGVLLSEPELLPGYFASFHAPLERVREGAAARGMSALEFALAFVNSMADVDVAVVGVSGIGEFAQVLRAAEAACHDAIDWSAYACTDEALVNPGRWRL